MGPALWPAQASCRSEGRGSKENGYMRTYVNFRKLGGPLLGSFLCEGSHYLGSISGAFAFGKSHDMQHAYTGITHVHAKRGFPV